MEAEYNYPGYKMHQKITLKNGLRVILIPRKSNDSMTAIIAVRTGSGDESDEIAGVSHLLEHILGKGSKKRPTPYDVSNYIESIGGYDNAFTSKIYTGYYVKVAKEFWRESIDYLSDNFLRALMLEEKIESEKSVIIEEIKMHDDIMTDVVSNLYSEAAFGRTAMGRDIAGSKESVAALTRSDLNNYYHNKYHAKNAVLAIAGNWETDDSELIKFIEENFVYSGDFNEKIETPKYKIEPEFLSIDTREAEQTNLLIGFPGPAMDNADWYAASLLVKIIGGGAASRMFQEVREKRGLAYDVRSGMASYLSGVGEIGTLAGVSNEKWYEATGAILDVYNEVIREGITEAELTKAKNMVKGGMLIELEDTEELAWEYCANELLLGEIITPEETLRRFQKIQISDIVEVSKRYLNMDNLYIGAVGPTLEKSKLATFIKS